jgi:hypothetical protein
MAGSLFAAASTAAAQTAKPEAASAEVLSAVDTAPKQDGSEGVRQWFQLVNVTIPPDSTHRKRDDLDKPPQLYVVVEKNGEVIEGHSSIKTGWSADFAAKEENMWPVWSGTDDRYSIEVWDSNWLSDVQIVKITELSGKDFEKIIYEDGGVLDDKSRLVRITLKASRPPMEKK